MATDRGPVVITVGPYHHHSPSSGTPPLITRAKKCGIVMFFARPLFGLDPADFLGWAHDNEDRARNCYERDSFTVGSEELVEKLEMLLLDGCLLLFAVFLLRRSVCEDQRPAELARDPEHGTDFIYLSADISLHMKQTRLDLLMLDNQIPFFVLEELHNRLKGTLFRDNKHNIQELAVSCFDDIHPSRFRSPRDTHTGATAAAANDELPPTVLHLLHLFHWSRVPRASAFSGASSRSSRTISDVALASRPTPFAWLGLQSEADAKVLRKRGILMHTQKTDKEIVDFFRGLKDEYSDTLMPDDLLKLCKDVVAHRRSRAGRVVKWIGRQCFPRQTVTFFVIFGTIISNATLV
ncbi:hypothetical protein EJB05_22204, partial [Eragrostis curvula]